MYRMRHRRPYAFWPMSQQMECHTVWQPNLWKLEKEETKQLINCCYCIAYDV